MIDMTQNRVPYGLLTYEEKAALHEHQKAGGELEVWFSTGGWIPTSSCRFSDLIYRAVPLPLTQDEIAWDRLPSKAKAAAKRRVQWVRDALNKIAEEGGA